MSRQLVSLALAGALVVAACGTAGDGPDVETVASTDPTTTTAPPADDPTDADDPTNDDPTALAIGDDETAFLDDAEGAPTIDSNVPATGPDSAIGRIGFTRYVYVNSGGQAIPSLVEGPIGPQVRCQDPDLDCSAAELRALAAAGSDAPHLGMSADEVATLVAELDAVADAIASFPTPESACAAGFRPDRTQTPNMGSHFTNMDRILDGRFAPGEPEIIMFARPDGIAPDGPLGTCTADGGWDGVDARPVGVAYYQAFAFVGDSHFDGFTGDLDNWHIHYNLCRLDGRDVTVPPSVCAGQGGTVGEFEGDTRPSGDASQGWMIHAWADPDHDSQLGVFSMWNPSVWPVTDVAGDASLEGLDDRRGGGTEVIDDFTLPDIRLAEPGTVTIFNVDGVAHTATAGSAEAPGSQFDTGIVGARSTGSITIAEPGTYDYFCELHPEMQGTITVDG